MLEMAEQKIKEARAGGLPHYDRAITPLHSKLIKGFENCLSFCIDARQLGYIPFYFWEKTNWAWRVYYSHPLVRANKKIDNVPGEVQK